MTLQTVRQFRLVTATPRNFSAFAASLDRPMSSCAQIENAILEGKSLVITFNAFEGAWIGILRHRSQKVYVQGLGFGFCFGKGIRFDRAFYLLWRQQEYLRFKAMTLLDRLSDL